MRKKENNNKGYRNEKFKEENKEFKDKGVKESLGNPPVGCATGVNAKKAIANWKFATDGDYEIDDAVIVMPYAVSHVAVDVAQFNADYLDDHKADIEVAARRAAGAYNLSFTASDIDDILEEMSNVIKASHKIASTIFYMHKVQNRTQVMDAEGRSLHELFNCVADYHTEIGFDSVTTTEAASAKVLGEWAITNAEWSKKFLQKLNFVYIREDDYKTLLALFDNIVQLKECDDSTVRYADFVPYHFSDGTITDKDSVITYLEACVTTVQNAFNKYAFLQPMFELLGMSAAKYMNNYDLTRDLSQNTLNTLVDQDNAIYDMIYSITAARLNSDDSEYEHESTAFCIYNTSQFPGIFPTVRGPREVTRIAIEIKTLTNALRGNVFALNNTVQFWTFGGPGENVEISICISNPLFINTIANPDGATVAIMHTINIANRQWAYLDLPTQGVSIRVMDFNESGKMKSWKYQNILGLNDYVLSSDDIETIISDAVYDLVFGDIIEKYLAAVPTVNTLVK